MRDNKQALSIPPQLEILDLRHYTGTALAPLLRDEGARWSRRMSWDYTASINLLLEYLDTRVLPGFVALDRGRIAGYCFAVFEGTKAVVGDVYSFGETEQISNPVGDVLLTHLLEMLQATPGVDRVESQLLMYPTGALPPFLAAGFQAHPRLFMMGELSHPAYMQNIAMPTAGLRLERWQPEAYEAAAELIHRCYLGHGDAQINDQYQTVAGAQRFLHNIIRFPGCGTFDPAASLLLRDERTGSLQAIILCSLIRADVGHITQLCIKPALRGLGLGRVLLAHTAEVLRHTGAQSLSLTVTEANTRAVALYEALGFTTQHRFDAMTWDKR